MRLNDSLLQQCLFEGVVVEKILPPPPQRHVFQVVVADGEDITGMPGADRLFELMIKYGAADKVPLADVPAEYLPIVKLMREEKIVLKSVEDDRPQRATHRTYGYALAQYRGDVAFSLYGGKRPADALVLTAITRGNKKSSLEYFAGTWERTDTVSKYPVNLIHEKALWYGFALGVGFGERVQSATIQSKRDDQYLLDAKISIWPGQVHDARLTVDAGGLVREAAIDCTYKRIRSTSSGSLVIRDTGARIAASGEIAVGAASGRELDNFTVELSGLPASVTADEFDELCDLSIPADGRRRKVDRNHDQADDAGFPTD